MASATTLRIELLGGFRVLAGGRADTRLPGARQQQLIALLILQARDAPMPRQRCAAALWPDSPDGQALTNLRRELHHLREAWPELEALIGVGSRTLSWHGRKATIDLLDFQAAADRGATGDRGALVTASRLYKGDLLPDCDAEWIESDRDRLRQAGRKALTRLVGVLEEDGSFADAVEHAQHLCRLDPLDESAWCALMRCHARRGARAAALHAYQECANILRQELGVQPGAEVRTTYREVLALDAAESAAGTAPSRSSIFPMVGRHAEWQALAAAWHGTDAARPRLAVIRGESGIGKTRLVEELADWCRTKNILALSSRCYAGDGRLPYAPIAAWLRSESLDRVLMTLEPNSLGDVARLRPDVCAMRTEVTAPAERLESWQRLRFFESIAQVFRSAGPVVLILDDLQWADADTVDWLEYFFRPTARGGQLLVVAAVRSEEEQDNPPLARLLDQLNGEGLLTPIALGPLDVAATGELAAAVAGRALDDEACARAFRETEGHPLFIVERGRMDAAKEAGEPGDAASRRVQAVVAARLKLLSRDAKAAAEVAAAIGRDFRFDILAEASDLEEDGLVRALDELWHRHVVRVHSDERWDFSHDRIREVAYDGIGPARARLIHRRVAQAMERLCAGHLDDVSAVIATHLERGGLPARAVPFLQRAADAAIHVSANEEAIRCVTHALSLVEQCPAGQDRDRQELALRAVLSVALNSARGYAAPEVEANLDRVFVLLRAADGGRVPVRWLWAAFTLRFVLGEIPRARAVSEEALAGIAADASCQCEAHHAMAATLMSAGELAASRRHFDAALAAYDERRPRRSALGSDLGVFAHAWYSHVLWLLGDERQALAHAGRGRALAQRLDHRFSETLAAAYAGLLHQMRHDTSGVLECAETVVTLCDRYGFAYYGDWARILIGWARGQDKPAAGVEMIQSALARLDARREQARRPYFLSLLAATHTAAGKRDRAAPILDGAIAMARERSDVWWLPALFLQKSEIEPAPRRDATLRAALDLARAQGSRALEQRIRRTIRERSAG